MTLKDKIRGLFLGVGIGDAFGMPFESRPYEVVKNIKKRENYRSGRWKKRGSTTDDCQLTLATANAILETPSIDMDRIAEHHVKAYNDTVSGWGSTTREAVKKISEGVHWSQSGDFNGAENRGLGNGIPMKAAPLAAYFALTSDYYIFNKICVDFTAMTHQTSIAVSSCFAHIAAIVECLGQSQTSFNTKDFLRKVIRASEMGRSYFPNTLKDDLTDRLKTLLPLYETPKLLYDDEYLVTSYGGGSCYVYNSLPFAYAFFIRGPFTIQSMVDVAYCGGDADTNASFVGGLLGALCGEQIFPDHLKENLDKREEIVKAADGLCEKFALGKILSLHICPTAMAVRCAKIWICS